MLGALMAYKRGEPRVCAMVCVPTPEEEDRRRISRERKALTAERVAHVNRIKGLLFSQGIKYEPLHRDRRARLEQLKTGDGRALPDHMKRQISRELDRLELLHAGNRIVRLVIAHELEPFRGIVFVSRANQRFGASGEAGAILPVKDRPR